MRDCILTIRWLMTAVRALWSPLRQCKLRARHSNSAWLHICSSRGPNESSGWEKYWHYMISIKKINTRSLRETVNLSYYFTSLQCSWKIIQIAGAKTSLHKPNHLNQVNLMFFLKFTSASQNVCGNLLQLLSEEGHVGLSGVNALQHCDWRLSLWELNREMPSIHLKATQVHSIATVNRYSKLK